MNKIIITLLLTIMTATTASASCSDTWATWESKNPFIESDYMGKFWIKFSQVINDEVTIVIHNYGDGQPINVHPDEFTKAKHSIGVNACKSVNIVKSFDETGKKLHMSKYVKCSDEVARSAEEPGSMIHQYDDDDGHVTFTVNNIRDTSENKTHDILSMRDISLERYGFTNEASIAASLGCKSVKYVKRYTNMREYILLRKKSGKVFP